MALGSVLKSLHADVRIGSQASFADDGEVCPLRIVVLKKPGCHDGKHRSVLVNALCKCCLLFLGSSE